MKVLLTLLIFISVVSSVPEKRPYQMSAELDFSPEMIARFNTEESMEKCFAIYRQMNKEGRDTPTKEEQNILQYCNEGIESIWDTDEAGCSWYCGGGPRKISASSHLTGQGENTYTPENAHDFSYKDAWVEGVNGYGIGEYLLYEFAPGSPRITDIIVVNGYVKSKKAWQENSRVKKLRVYYKDEPLADLLLEDSRTEQYFKFDPIGYGDRSNIKLLEKKEPWTLKFEILDVYKGSKYDDTVISEIYFDGIDVH